MEKAHTILLSEQLKAETLASHQALEKVLVTRMRGMRDMADYTALISKFYSYFGALEDRIKLFVTTVELPDYPQRRKTETLANDIRSLGGDVPDKATLANIPVIEDHLQAFGALYVIEGSTLGGKIIVQMLTKQLNVPLESLTFFSGYGDEGNAMWDTFKQTLNKQAKSNEEETIIIQAAESTFSKFKDWFEK